jgi:hypothetical protein
MEEPHGTALFNPVPIGFRKNALPVGRYTEKHMSIIPSNDEGWRRRMQHAV